MSAVRDQPQPFCQNNAETVERSLSVTANELYDRPADQAAHRVCNSHEEICGYPFRNMNDTIPETECGYVVSVQAVYLIHTSPVQHHRRSSARIESPIVPPLRGASFGHGCRANH